MSKVSLKAKVGDKFTVVVNDGVVLMQVEELAHEDIWRVSPLDTGGEYADEYAYGAPKVMTDDEVYPHVKRFRFLTAKRA